MNYEVSRAEVRYPNSEPRSTAGENIRVIAASGSRRLIYSTHRWVDGRLHTPDVLIEQTLDSGEIARLASIIDSPMGSGWNVVGTTMKEIQEDAEYWKQTPKDQEISPLAVSFFSDYSDPSQYIVRGDRPGTHRPMFAGKLWLKEQPATVQMLDGMPSPYLFWVIDQDQTREFGFNDGQDNVWTLRVPEPFNLPEMAVDVASDLEDVWRSVPQKYPIELQIP
jgi:hypothetical protein